MSSSLQVSCTSQQELPVGGTLLEKDLQRAADSCHFHYQHPDQSEALLSDWEH